MTNREAIHDDSVLRARRPHPTRRSGTGLVLMAVAAGFLWGGTPCQAAGLLISAPAVNAAAGSSGAFDVTITNTNGTNGTSYDVAGDTVELALGPSGVNFTGVSIATADTYIYAVSATTQGSVFSYSTFPGTVLETFDFDVSSVGFREIDPGQTFGLVHVTYSVAAGAAPGTGSLTFGPDTSLSDPTGANITDFSVQAGSFTVTSTSIPEPSSLILLAVGGVSVLFWRARNRGVR
jgi:hypothetical protein